MPPPSEATQRYRIIDKLLRNSYNTYPSLDDLCKAVYKELGTKVSRETMQKDIALMKSKLKDGGYEAPILYKKAFGGYCYDPNFPDYSILNFGFNEKSLETIQLAAGVLQRFQGIMASDAYHNALNKLYSALNIERSAQDKNLVNAILPQETTYLRGMENFKIFVDAIKLKKPVSLIHYSYSHRKFKCIIVHPYLLKESNDRWYVYGFSESEEHIKEPLRFFGIDRIYDPIIVNKDFIEAESDEYRTAFSNKIGINVLKKDVLENTETITLWVSSVMANFIKSMPLHKSQTIQQYGFDGDILVSINVVPTKELVSLVLSYGQNMELIEPKWLRKEIKKELLQMTSNYSE